MDDIQEIMEDFLIEAFEMVEQLDQDLVELESNPEDLDLLNRIFRVAHTIKGSSSFLNFDILTSLTHHMEDVLNKARRAELKITPDVMDVVLQSVDLMKALLSAIRDNGTDANSGIDITDIVKRLQEVSGDSGEEKAPAQEASQETNKEDSKPAEQSVNATDNPLADEPDLDYSSMSGEQVEAEIERLLKKRQEADKARREELKKQGLAPNIQAPSAPKEEQSSAFAIGAFASSIVDISISGGSGSNYKASSFGIVLMEIPVGYAYKLGTEFGDFNFGVAMKYLRAVFDHSSYGGNAYNGIEVSMPNFLTMSPSQNFGIDLGFLYSYADFHIGVTAKNINCPTFKGSGEKIQLDPQLRLGMSYEFAEHYVVAMDIDLLPYDSYSVAAPKSQYFGIGIMGDYTKFDFRFGISADMLGKDGAKISAGFNAFGILDIVGEMGTNFAKFKGSKLATPTNFGFKIGSTFTF